MTSRPGWRTLALAVVLMAATLGGTPRAEADTTTLIAARDTFFTDQNSTVSNGNGVYACIGMNGVAATSRALYYFDLSTIPAGSYVTDVQLDLWVAPNAQGQAGVLDLHAVLQDWGEGLSDAPQGPGVSPVLVGAMVVGAGVLIYVVKVLL